MMIMGFAITAGIAGKLLDPFSPLRLSTTSCTGFSALWFVAGELRKWFILLYPESFPAKLLKW